MTDKLRDAAQQALSAPGCERLKDWYEIGPAQRAAVETFLEAALSQQDAQALEALIQASKQAVPLPEHETEAMHDAVMAVMYKGVTRTNTNALWQAYRCAILNSAPTSPVQQDAQAPGSDIPGAVRRPLE